MIKLVLEKIKLYRKLRFIKYVYYNYFCEQIEHKGKGHIFPYKGAILDMEPGSRIILQDGDIELGCNLLKGSKSETLVRLRRGATWISNKGGAQISYGATVEVLKNATLNSGYFTMNSGSTIIVEREIILGYDVMIARNVVIYDSDFHPLLDEKGTVTNPSEKVTIGNHVWIGANSTILKGVNIGPGAVIGAGTKIVKSVTEQKLVVGQVDTKEIREYVDWRR